MREKGLEEDSAKLGKIWEQTRIQNLRMASRPEEYLFCQNKCTRWGNPRVQSKLFFNKLFAENLTNWPCDAQWTRKILLVKKLCVFSHHPHNARASEHYSHRNISESAITALLWTRSKRRQFMWAITWQVKLYKYTQQLMSVSALRQGLFTSHVSRRTWAVHKSQDWGSLSQNWCVLLQNYFRND